VKIGRYLRWAGIGWLVGVGAMLIIGFLVLPATIGSKPMTAPGTMAILTSVLLLVSPVAIFGGIAGGRLQVEGGSGSGVSLAAIGGLCAAIPFSCIGFWVNGW
jgi:NhaP-type Na+/H+ and K+/H+ antiporter